MGKKKDVAEKAQAQPILITSLNELDSAIAEAGELESTMVEIARQHAQAMAELNTKQEAELEDSRTRMEALVSGIHAFAESNRETLVKPGTKTIERPTGTVAWRMTPPAIDWGKLTKEKVVALLKALGLERLVRTVQEPNKEAMLADPDAIKVTKRIKIVQREELVVKPTNGTSIVREVRHLLKRVTA